MKIKSKGGSAIGGMKDLEKERRKSIKRCKKGGGVVRVERAG